MSSQDHTQDHTFLKASLRSALTLMCALIFAYVFTSPSHAEPPSSAPSKVTPAKSATPQGATVSAKLKARTQKARVKAQSELPSGGGKVIEFKALSVEGTVQRPSAAYLLQRRKLKFRGLEPKKSFLSEVIKSVKRPPF